MTTNIKVNGGDEGATEVAVSQATERELTVLAKIGTSERTKAMVKSVIERAGGRITKIDDEGEKRLAYPIQDEEYAHYLFFEYTIEDKTGEKVNDNYDEINRFDGVLRSLDVKVVGRRGEA